MEFTQHVMVVYYRRFGTNCRFHHQRSSNILLGLLDP